MPITKITISTLNKACPEHQRGFTLLEVMISVVITGFALLGLAGLQLSSVNTTNVAYTQSQSMMVINELVDQMHANSDAARNGSFDISTAPGGTLKSFADMGTEPDNSASEIEKLRYYWFENVDRTLPGARAAVKCFSSGQCTILVRYTNVDKDKTSTAVSLEQIVSIQL